jgi:hypothetical protein
MGWIFRRYLARKLKFEKMYGPPALSQAKSEDDGMVLANIGLNWSVRLLAMMECAALSSYLIA